MKKPGRSKSGLSAKTTRRPIFAFAGLGLLVLTLVASTCYYYYYIYQRASPLSPTPSTSVSPSQPPPASATFIQSPMRSSAPRQPSIKSAPLKSYPIPDSVTVTKDSKSEPIYELDGIMNDFNANLTNIFKSADVQNLLKHSASKATSSSSVMKPITSTAPQPQAANNFPVHTSLPTYIPTTDQAPPSVVKAKSHESLMNSNAKDSQFAVGGSNKLEELNVSLRKGQEQREESRKVVKETTAQVEQTDRELEEMMRKATEDLN